MKSIIYSFFVTLFFLQASYAQVYKKAVLKKDQNAYKQVHFHTDLPIIDIKNSDESIFKTIKAPTTGCYGVISADEKYVFAINPENLYRIKIEDNTWTAVPYKQSEILGEGEQWASRANVALFGLTKSSSKLYLYNQRTGYGSENAPIFIYEADFEKGTFSKSMSIEKTTTIFAVGSSWHNNYLFTLNAQGKAKVYDIQTKKIVKELQIDLNQNDITNRDLSIVTCSSYDGILRLAFIGQKNLGADSNWKYLVEYNLYNNKIVKEVFREGELFDAKEVYSFENKSKVKLMFISKLNDLPPYPRATELKVLPTGEQNTTKGTRERWIQEFKELKKDALKTIKANPDSSYVINVYSEPYIISKMNNANRMMMKDEYREIIQLRDSLKSSLNQKVRIWNEESTDMSKRSTTVFYLDENCKEEAFRIKGNVFYANFIEHNLLDLWGTGSSGMIKRKFNTETKTFVEDKDEDDDF